MRRQCATVRENKRFKMVSLIFKNLEGNAYKISKKHRAKRNKRDLIKTRVNDAPRRHHHLCLLFRRCFSVASSFVNEKSPNHPFCCCLAMIGRKKGGGSFVFRGEREAKNQKKSKISSLLFWASLSRHAGNKHEKKKKQFLLAPKLRFFPPVRPSSRRI